MSYLDAFNSEVEILNCIVNDYMKGLPSLSPYIKSLSQLWTPVDLPDDPMDPLYIQATSTAQQLLEKVQGWNADAGRYITGCLWPLTESLVNLISVGQKTNPTQSCQNEDALFGLNEAIAIQFYYQLDDGNPWQTCKYEPCKKWFKYQRQNTQPTYLTPKKRGGTGFCCKSHNVMENRRLNNAATTAASRYLKEGLSSTEAAKHMATRFTQQQIQRALEKIYSIT